MSTRFSAAVVVLSLASSAAAQSNDPPVFNVGVINDYQSPYSNFPQWIVAPIGSPLSMPPSRIDEFGRVIGQSPWARPNWRVKLYCADSDTGDACVGLRVIDPSGLVLASGGPSSRAGVGQLMIDTVLDLSAYDGQAVTLTFEAVDTHGAGASLTHMVHVDTSPRLTVIPHVGYTGFGATAEEQMYTDWASWDVSPTARFKVVPWPMLHSNPQRFGTPMVPNWFSTGQYLNTFNSPGGDRGMAGFLTPVGAVWLVDNPNAWASPQVVAFRRADMLSPFEGGSVVGATDHDTRRYPMLQAKGNFAAWPQAGTLRRYRVTDLTSTTVATDAYLTSWMLAGNGDLVWQDCPDSSCTGGGIIRRSRLDHAPEVLAIAPAGAAPAADGVNVVWRSGDSVLLHVEGAPPAVLATGLAAPSYRVAQGWIAVTRPDAGGGEQVWVRSPAGVETQLTTLAAPWVLDALADTGEVMFTGNGRRYFAAVGRRPVDISSDQGIALWRAGTWYVAMGRIFLKVAIPPRPLRDFDADGRADLVWRNAATGENTVWFMNGAAKAGAASLPRVPDGCWLLAVVADLNGDSHPDLIWRHRFNGANVLWLMDGTTITATMNLPFVNDPNWRLIAGADIDVDGHQDLIWRHAVTGGNAVWYMNGTTFRAVAALPPADAGWSLAAAIDMNGDRHPDLVWRNERNGTNVVWLLNGTAFVSGVTLPAMPAAWALMAVQDLDGDGSADLVWRALRAVDGNPAGTNAVWFMNATAVQSTAALETVADTNWVIAHPNAGAVLNAVPSDFNADGRPDLLWRNAATGAVGVWFLDETTWLGAADLPAVPDANWALVATGDFDSDGHSDVLWRHRVSGSNAVWFMDETTIRGVGNLPSVDDPAWRVVTVVDLDRNGAPDVIWRNTITGATTAWAMAGTSIATTMILPARPDVQWLLAGAADINGDEYPDLIWRHPLTGANEVWYMNGATQIGSDDLPPLAGAAWGLVATIDANVDGVTEFIWHHARTGAMQLWRLAGVTLASSAPLPAMPDTTWTPIPAPASRIPAPRNDLDGDGRADLVWRHAGSGSNIAWYMHGATPVGAGVLPDVPDWSWTLIGTPDLNGDTHPDQVWWNVVAHTSVAWFMQGPTLLAMAALPAPPDGSWQLRAIGDVNGDGAPDLVFQQPGTGASQVWCLNGTALLATIDLPVMPDPAALLVDMADLDGDGQSDVLWRDPVSGVTSVWYVAAGVVIGTATLPTMDPAWTLAGMPDLNADGHADVVWSHRPSGQNVVWYLDGVTVIGSDVLPVVSVGWELVR